MDEHIDIFNIIYSIKDKISDNDFLELNNKIQKLIQENRQLKTSNEIHIYVSDSEESEESEEESEELEEESEHNQCICSTRWGLFDSNIDSKNVDDYFCLDSIESIKKCENFKRLFDTLPLMKNLINKIDLPFVEEPIEQEYVKELFIFIVRILLSLVDRIIGKRKKIIIFFVMYDYLIRNINFLKDNQKFTEGCLKKYEEIVADEDLVYYAREYNVNYLRWNEILKSILQVE